MSTAILPDAQLVNSGHSTAMKLAAILQRIEQRLKAINVSADDASRRAGVPDAIRNMRRNVATGKGGVTLRVLASLAPVLETTLPWLLGEEDRTPVDDLNLDELQLKRDVLLAQVHDVQTAISHLAQQETDQKRRP